MNCWKAFSPVESTGGIGNKWSRWGLSALLVNVDNDTLARLLASDETMDALMRIEDFRSLNADIEAIINKSNDMKQSAMRVPSEEILHQVGTKIIWRDLRKINLYVLLFNLIEKGF